MRWIGISAPRSLAKVFTPITAVVPRSIDCCARYDDSPICSCIQPDSIAATAPPIASISAMIVRARDVN